MSSKTDCIFCKIVAGEIPCHKVYEDESFLAFLDIHPLNPGHTLLIPKNHYRWVDDVPDFGAYWEAAKKIGFSIKEHLQPKAIYYLTMGLQVAHAHIHIVPRFSDDGHSEGLDLKQIKSIAGTRMAAIAAKLKI